ncbi:MAG: HemK family protein methyltransferase [Gaiellales bacterium]|nr:MAG: HemK family protein methyltransferase [Gaiellales bacterium]
MEAGKLIEQAKSDLRQANDLFGYKGDEEDQAWELLAHALGEEPEWEDEVPAAAARRFRRLVDRRATGEPLAYIVGRVEFRDLKLGIRKGMFIPRLTSEFLAAQAVRRLHGRELPVHVDLATGIGPVAISTARAVPTAEVWGLDISHRAISQARANARELGLANASFRVSDLYAQLPRRFRGNVDIVTMHPPYVPRGEVRDLPEEIRNYEPGHTLTDGSRDGLGLLGRAIRESGEWVRPGGWMLVEIVPSETRKVMPLLKAAGYRQVRSTCGPLRHTRVITARRQ